MTGPRRHTGFSLIWLAVILVGLGAALAVTVSLLPQDNTEERVAQTVRATEDARHHVLGFAIENGRLPAPDSDGDGTEDAGAVRGALPWRDIGLAAALLDSAHLPIHYAPYRNASADADLADPTNLYQPEYPDLDGLISGPLQTAYSCPADTTSPVNLLDLCTALGNAGVEAASADPAYASVTPASGIENVAHVLASGGLENADGTGGAGDLHFDGDNLPGDPTPVSFDDPARGRAGNYDDVVRYTTLAAVERELACVAHLASLAQLEAAASSGADIVEDAVSMREDAITQISMAVASAILGVVDIAATVGGLAGIVADIPKASGGCNVPPNVLCCPALGALIAGTVVYGVTAAVQIAALVTTFVELGFAIDNFIRIDTELLPHAQINLCNLLTDLHNADLRGGL